MSTPVQQLKGASETIVEALRAQGFTTNEQLVEAAATPEQRKQLAADCQCEAKDLLELANRADLARIKGVSGVYSDLLENAGVDTVKELATRNAANLHAKLEETNAALQLAGREPTAAQVEDWVAQAKDLPKHLSY